MLSEDKIIGIFCLVDDLLKGMGHHEDSRIKISGSEVITMAVASALYSGGHIDNGHHFMKMTGMASKKLDKSRLCRRLHRLEFLLCSLFFQAGRYLQTIAGACDYVIDSFPVAVCDNIHISCSKLLQRKHWRGKQCSMRRYFYGVKVQVLTIGFGIPVSFCFVPGRESDVQALKKLPTAVAPESKIYGGSAYTDYTIEDDVKQADLVKLMIQRKSNSKRPGHPWIRFLKPQMRKGIETSFSMLKGLFLRKTHAVTFKGFLLKILMFIIGFTFNKLVL